MRNKSSVRVGGLRKLLEAGRGGGRNPRDRAGCARAKISGWVGFSRRAAKFMDLAPSISEKPKGVLEGIRAGHPMTRWENDTRKAFRIGDAAEGS